jgi:hypothetical protein
VELLVDGGVGVMVKIMVAAVDLQVRFSRRKSEKSRAPVAAIRYPRRPVASENPEPRRF